MEDRAVNLASKEELRKYWSPPRSLADVVSEGGRLVCRAEQFDRRPDVCWLQAGTVAMPITKVPRGHYCVEKARKGPNLLPLRPRASSSSPLDPYSTFRRQVAFASERPFLRSSHCAMATSCRSHSPSLPLPRSLVIGAATLGNFRRGREGATASGTLRAAQSARPLLAPSCPLGLVLLRLVTSLH